MALAASDDEDDENELSISVGEEAPDEESEEEGAGGLRIPSSVNSSMAGEGLEVPGCLLLYAITEINKTKLHQSQSVKINEFAIERK